MDKETTELARDIGARLMALQAGLSAVIRSHPDPKEFLHCLDQLEEGGLARMLNLPWSEDQISTYQDTIASLRLQTSQK